MSSQPRLLISRADFNNLVKQSGNLDKVDIYPYIIEAQREFLPNLLGKTLYSELLNEYNSQTLSSSNQALLPYVQDYLVYKSYDLALPDHVYNFTNDGILKTSKENYQPISSNERHELMQRANQRSDRYKNRLYEFLDENQNDYPTWDAGRHSKGGTLQIGRVGRKFRKPYEYDVYRAGRRNYTDSGDSRWD